MKKKVKKEIDVGEDSIYIHATEQEFAIGIARFEGSKQTG